MPLYRCVYEIDIEVDTKSPEEAARLAYHYMTAPGSLPPALQVTERRPGGPALGETVLIDLSELLSAPEQGSHEPAGLPVTPHELY